MEIRNRSRGLAAMACTALAFAVLAMTGCTAPVARPSREAAPPPRSGVNWRQYHRIIVDPVQVHRGQDARFGKIPPRSQDDLARYMQDRFTERLARDFDIVRSSGPNTLRLTLILTGAHPAPPALGTFSHFDLAGGSYNAVQGLPGKSGMASAALTYTVEIRDAPSGRLLDAHVSRQFAAAGRGAMNAAEQGVETGADELAEQIAGNEPGRARAGNDCCGRR